MLSYALFLLHNCWIRIVLNYDRSILIFVVQNCYWVHHLGSYGTLPVIINDLSFICISICTSAVILLWRLRISRFIIIRVWRRLHLNRQRFRRRDISLIANSVSLQLSASSILNSQRLIIPHSQTGRLLLHTLI